MLRWLRKWMSHIGKKGAKALVQNTVLTSLYLYATKIGTASKTALKKIQKSNPNVKIDFDDAREEIVMTIKNHTDSLATKGSLIINYLRPFFWLIVLITQGSICIASENLSPAVQEDELQARMAFPVTFSAKLDPIIGNHLRVFGYSDQKVRTLFATCQGLTDKL